MERALFALGTACARRPGRVVLTWLTAVVLLAAAGNAFGGPVSDNLTLPGTETQQAVELLEDRFPDLAGGSATLVFRSAGGFADRNQRVAVAATVEAVAALPGVVLVEDPLAETAARSEDGTIALAQVHYGLPAFEVGQEGARQLEAALFPAREAGVQAEAGGEVPYANAPAETGAAELIGILAAIVILAVAFGSIVAMGIPVATALLGLIAGSSALALLANAFDVPSAAPAVASMIGIGVGIDYALFVVTRFREHLASGSTPIEAAGLANATAGAAVVLAGVTVMIAILGLFLTGIGLVGMLGLAAALVVAAAIGLAITLLPALLGWLGHRVDRLHLPGIGAGVDSPLAGDGRYHGWARWSHWVADRPWRFLTLSAGLLLVLAAPLLSLRLGMPDAGTSPESQSVRRAYDLVADGFGPGANGPLLVVATLPAAGGADAPANAALVNQLTNAIGADPGVAAVSPAAANEAGNTVVISIVPTTSPQDQATTDLVHRLRGGEIDAIAAEAGSVVYLAGPTAGFLDLADALAARMPVFIGGVVGLSFVLLVVVFRSVLVPLKAVVLNLLSISAAYGVVVAVFQWGWGRSLIGVHGEVPIVSFVPIFMFAVLFGLSMDYHVFMLSRVREAYALSGDPRQSVADGLAGTARVITSAALVMICVFSAFVLGDDPVLKMMGLGLAVAIGLDASVVRLTLVPSTMALLGHANWWLPGWLDRLLPRLDLHLDLGRPAPGAEPALDQEPALPGR
jgi:RND superfamily putative drug exporter